MIIMIIIMIIMIIIMIIIVIINHCEKSSPFAAIHCQPPVWAIWSELSRQVWLWGDYSSIHHRCWKYHLIIHHAIFTQTPIKLFFPRNQSKKVDSHLFYFQVRRSAEHSLNMPLRLSLIPTNWFVIHFEFPHIWDILNLEKCLPAEKETNMRCFNIRFVWGALAEDNGNHLDPGDRGILRCRGRNDQINHNLSNWSRVVKLFGYHQIGKISSNKNTPYQVYHISSNWWTWFKIWMN